MVDITDAMRFEFLERAARRSRTGISFEWIPSVEGERSGYRFMRHHDIHQPHGDIRSAIDAALAKESSAT